MADNKRLSELKADLRILIEGYFDDKTGNCYFEGYEDVKRKLESYVDSAIGTCAIEVEFLDKEIDSEIEAMEEERNYVEACKRRGIRPGEDI